MPLINIQELITDPDFCQTFTVTRRSGTWENGRFIPVEQEFSSYGVIEPQDTSELDITNPDGSLIQGRIKVYAHDQLYVTILNDNPDNSGYISDEITWQNNKYAIILDNNYSDYGYHEYVAQLKDAAGGFTN